MSKLTKLMVVVMFAVFASGMIASQGKADAKTYQVSAVVPSATGAVFALYKVDGDGTQASQWTSLGTGTNIDFGTLTLQSATVSGQTYQWYTSPNFFVVDIFPNAGGSLTHTITYAETGKPTGQTNGLGSKAVAKFSQTVDGSADVSIASKLLKDLNSYSVNGSTFTAGRHLRIYLSLYDSLANAGLTGGEPFTPADKPGTYSGTVTVTAVVL